MTHNEQQADRIRQFMDYEAACREWMRGCSCAPEDKPWECADCTKAFHDHLTTLVSSGYTTVKEDRSTPKCADCKWPVQSKVAKSCPCMPGEGRNAEAHAQALTQARSLQRRGVPLCSPDYYDASEEHNCRAWFGGKCIECGAAYQPK